MITNDKDNFNEGLTYDDVLLVPQYSEILPRDVDVSTTTLLPYGYRAGLLSISLENKGQDGVDIPLEVITGGTLDKTEVWEFSRTLSQTPVPAALLEQGLTRKQQESVLALQTDQKDCVWNGDTSSASLTVSLAPGETKVIHFCFGLGNADVADTCRLLLTDAPAHIEHARAEYHRRMDEIFTRLPRLTSDNPDLDRFYARSLVHLLTNRWETPEFVLHPYYSTGSIKGGCICEYLWNFGEVWEILPLYDPDAAREHIKQFLKLNQLLEVLAKP